jgi:hypothetical protein
VFDDVVVGRGGVSSVEHGLTAVLVRPVVQGGPAVVDAVYPALLWAHDWEVELVAAATAELDRLLAAGAPPLARAAAAAREMARLSAVVATSLAEFARCRPAALFDRQRGERGAMSAATRAARPAALTAVSEWAVDEVAPTLRISSAAATAQLAEALVLVERLPGTLRRLSRGELSPAHARQMVATVGQVADDVLRADIEAHVLGLLGDKTPPQLGDSARRIVLRRDAEAAGRRLVAAIRERGVRLHDRATAPARSPSTCRRRSRRRSTGRWRPTPSSSGSTATSGPGSSGWPTCCATWCCARTSTACRRSPSR